MYVTNTAVKTVMLKIYDDDAQYAAFFHVVKIFQEKSLQCGWYALLVNVFDSYTVKQHWLVSIDTL